MSSGTAVPGPTAVDMDARYMDDGDTLASSPALSATALSADTTPFLRDHRLASLNDLAPEEGRGKSFSQPEKGTKFFGAVANLANAVIGGGVVAFPFAFMNTGAVLGVILTIVFAALIMFTLHILAVATTAANRIKKADSYQSVVEALLGPMAGRLLAIAMAIYLFGSCAAYQNIIADQVTAIAPSGVLHDRVFVIAVVTAAVIIPLSCLRDLSALQFTSLLAVVAVVWLEGDVVARAALDLASNGLGPDVLLFNWSYDIFQAFPLICFALQCHLVFFPVFCTLDAPRTPSRMNLVSTATLAIALFLYIPTGILGYLQYGADTASDITQNLPAGMADTTVTRLCIGFTAIFSYPLLHFVVRTVLADLIFPGVDINEPDQRAKYYGLTLAFIVATSILSATVQQLSDIVAYTGDTAAVVQIFVFPGLLYAKSADTSSADGGFRQRAIGYSLVSFGVIMGAISLTNQIISTVDG